MMDLTKIQECEFLCDGNRTITGDTVATFEITKPIVSGLSMVSIRPLSGGYEIHTISEDKKDVAVLQNGEIVGFYLGELLAVDAKHGYKGLATAMILEAVKHRPLPDRRIVTLSGEKALRRAWRVANGLERNPHP